MSHIYSNMIIWLCDNTKIRSIYQDTHLAAPAVPNTVVVTQYHSKNLETHMNVDKLRFINKSLTQYHILCIL